MKIVAYLLVMICATTCGKKNIKTNTGDVDAGMIYGKWNWVSSKGGFAGKTITPKSTGYEESVEYKRSNNVYYYRNGKPKNQAKFTITKGNSIFSDKPSYIIKYAPDAIDQVIIKTTNDTLILADNVYDGFTITYVKDK